MAAPRTPGSTPGQGANAAVELAHQLLAVAALARPELGNDGARRRSSRRARP